MSNHTVCQETSQIQIKESNDRGRCAIAACSFRPGNVVTRNEALSHVVRSNHCDCCNARREEKLLRCSACQKAHYCNRACQRKDYVQHKVECPFLKDRLMMSGDDQQEIRLLLRTHGALNKLSRKTVTQCQESTTTASALAVSCGKDHFWDMAQAPSQLVHAPDSTQEIVSKYCNWSKETIRTVLQIFQANNFGILNGVHETIGQGVYPHAALLNHSCHPNCLVRFAGSTTMELVALRNIEAGEELWHSYVDLVSATRQEQLQQLHGFTCQCTRCCGKIKISVSPSLNTDDAFYESVVQHQRQQSLLGTNEGTLDCQVDRVTLPIDDALDYTILPDDQSASDTGLLSLGRELMQQAQLHMRNDDYEAERITLERAVNILKQMGRPFSRDLYQARGMYLSSLLIAASAAEEQEYLQQEAGRVCRAMVAFLAIALPPNHPLLGLQLYTLGDLTQSDDMHEWALRVLRVSHGSQHDYVRRLEAAGIVASR